jgi:hypothetical protein
MTPPGSNKRMGANAGFVPRFCHHDTRGAPSIFPAQKQEQSRISPSDTVVVLSYRMLIAFRARLRAVFLFGFAKSELDNIDDDQFATLRETAALWLAADAQKIDQAIKDGLLIEVRHDG